MHWLLAPVVLGMLCKNRHLTLDAPSRAGPNSSAKQLGICICRQCYKILNNSKMPRDLTACGRWVYPTMMADSTEQYLASDGRPH